MLHRVHLSGHNKYPDILHGQDAWYGEHLLYGPAPDKPMDKKLQEKQFATFMKHTNINLPGFNLNAPRHLTAVEL